jgi:hypothetical protein
VERSNCRPAPGPGVWTNTCSYLKGESRAGDECVARNKLRREHRELGGKLAAEDLLDGALLFSCRSHSRQLALKLIGFRADRIGDSVGNDAVMDQVAPGLIKLYVRNEGGDLVGGGRDAGAECPGRRGPEARIARADKGDDRSVHEIHQSIGNHCIAPPSPL